MGSEGLNPSPQATDADTGHPPAGSGINPTAPHPHPEKSYHRTKLSINLLASFLSFMLLVILIVTGVTRELAAWCNSLVSNEYATLGIFAAVLGVMQTCLTLPLRWYSGYVVEHRFGLSNQSLGRWAWEGLKEIFVGVPLMLVVLFFLYYSLERFGGMWWLPVAIAVTLLTVVLARIGPILILPLFYRLSPVDSRTLRDRIAGLCARAGVKIDGIYSFDLSKNTRKANAAFTGIGRAKRIVLGDTLLREFTEEEIEAVFAHELGHLAFGHIRTRMLIGTVSTFVGLYIASLLYEWSVKAAGFVSIADIAALPILAVWLSLFALVTSPVGNLVTRWHERQADAYAVKATGGAGAFVSALRKLGRMNLADPNPHPLIEFLMYSHPPIAKRIRAVTTGQS